MLTLDFHLGWWICMLDSRLLYRLYQRLGTEKNRLWAVRAAKMFTGRYLVVRLDTNFLCNLRCKTCFFSSPETESRFQRPMAIEDFERVAANLFRRARMVFLSCSAEPLVTPNFEEFLDVTGGYNIPVTGFITNGTLMRESVMEAAIRNRIDEITISIDGATPSTYESIRVRGKWDKLMAGLDIMANVKARLNASKPALRFNFTACRSNVHEIPQLVELAKEKQIDTVRIREFADWGGTLDFSKESLMLCPEDYNDSLSEARVRAEELGVELYAPRPFSTEGRSAEDGPSIEGDWESYSCVLPWYFAYVGPDGNYWPCFHLRDNGPSDGNLIETSWDEIRKQKEATARRNLLAHEPKASCLNVCQRKCSVEHVRVDWKGLAGKPSPQ